MEKIRHYFPREILYESDRIVIQGKVHWSDENYMVIKCYVLKDVIESDEVLPRWVWTYLVKVRDNWTCVRCGRHKPWKGQGRQSLSADHIEYIRNHQELGKHIMSNGETLCWSCHSKKHGNMRGNHNKHYRNTIKWKNASDEEKRKIMQENEDRKSIIDKS